MKQRCCRISLSENQGAAFGGESAYPATLTKTRSIQKLIAASDERQLHHEHPGSTRTRHRSLIVEGVKSR